MKPRQIGFTLIELMIVVANPAYQDYIEMLPQAS